MLFLISDGDYTTHADTSTAMQFVTVIAGDSVQDPLVQDAIDSLARVKGIRRDEVVVNELSNPIAF